MTASAGCLQVMPLARGCRAFEDGTGARLGAVSVAGVARSPLSRALVMRASALLAAMLLFGACSKGGGGADAGAGGGAGDVGRGGSGGDGGGSSGTMGGAGSGGSSAGSGEASAGRGGTSGGT